MARGLAVLPLIRDAYGQGRICWESVVALCKAANPDNEAELLDHALRMTSTELKALIAGLEPVDLEDANKAYEQRSLRYRMDPEGRVVSSKGCWPTSTGWCSSRRWST